MTTLTYAIDINASKANTWEVLANFSNLHWTQTVKNVYYITEKRGCVGTVLLSGILNYEPNRIRKI